MINSYSGMTVVLYARVSTDDKDQDTESQIMILKKWCKENDVIILDKYEDKVTGRTTDRPELDRMLGRIMKGGVNILLTLDTDRLSRDQEGMADIQKMIRPFGTVIRYYADLSTRPETEEGRLINDIKTYGAQKYASGHSLKIKAGQARHRAAPKEGKKPIGRPAAFIDLDVAMECASRGLSVSEAAAIMKVGRETLRRKLIAAGRIAEYYDLVLKADSLPNNPVLVKNIALGYQRSKTLMPDNTVSLYHNGKKEGGA